ncbi:hypothetical protein [Streptomyces sp. NPDC059278]|uniref:hypothetical protein n=1 Tax=Streptomyces sp. NPDC059278 TaxID=3346801 RepID=UPI0036A31CCB
MTATATPQGAANRLGAVINGIMNDVADTWVGVADGSVHLAFYDAADVQILLNSLNVTNPQQLSSKANVIDPRLTSLHLVFTDANDASFFASVLDLAAVDFPRH